MVYVFGDQVSKFDTRNLLSQEQVKNKEEAKLHGHTFDVTCVNKSDDLRFKMYC